MPLNIPPNFGIAGFVYTGAVGTQPYVTTVGVDLLLYQDNYATAADVLFTRWAATVLPETSSSLTLDNVTLFVNDGTNTGAVTSSNAAQAGALTGAAPPTAMSAIMRKQTGRLGRKGRGRMFLPGVLTETNVDPDGTIVAARRTQLNTALATFRNDLILGVGADEPMAPYLMHTDLTPPDPILAFTCSDLVGWIRGRIR